MKKLFKACLALAMAATLVACGEKAAPIAKYGLGTVNTYKDGQVNTTMVALGLDADGKIAYIDLDVAQSTFADPAKAKTETKEELKEKYGMLVASPIKKEWFEQAEAFEKWAKGKTPADVVAVQLVESNGHMVAKNEADLYAGCTMDISAFQEAVKKAADTARVVSAETVKFGRTMSNDTALNTTMVVYALDKDGKVVDSILDVAQIKEGVLLTKAERKGDYGMLKASPIGKEWFEQATAWEKWTVGKTLDAIVAVKTELVNNHNVAKGEADLYAGCTMDISAFQAATKKAK